MVNEPATDHLMNAHATPAQALNFRARSLLAFVLEPSQPLIDWFAALDAWLVRSPTFFAAKPVILELARFESGLKEYRHLLNDLARRHIRVMGVENPNPLLLGRICLRLSLAAARQTRPQFLRKAPRSRLSRQA